jgi:hypothetical protein
VAAWAFLAQHGGDASDHTDDADKDMETHHGQEERVN